MTRTTIATLFVLAGAAVVASQLEARHGMGVVAGVLCGTSVAMLGALWQRHSFLHRPKRAFNAVVETFLFKMVFVMIGALSFRYIEPAAARADWKAFLLTFVVVSLIVQTVAVFENVRLLTKTPGLNSLTPSAVKAGPLE
ncbi:MAG: NhaP-type Na+/H+ or K+/H+ antiporter [Planctomycetota bacterium]|jgi:NhaP-type Na+/H+ or K+/H+ antiporter